MITTDQVLDEFTAKQRGWAEYTMGLSEAEKPSEEEIGRILQELNARVMDDLDELIENGALVPVKNGYDGRDDIAVFSASEDGQFWERAHEGFDVSDDVWEYVDLIHYGYIKQNMGLVRGNKPFVLVKDDRFANGEQFATEHIAQLMAEHGLSASIVLDYVMVEERGLTQQEWADKARKSQGTVSDNVAQARTIINAK